MGQGTAAPRGVKIHVCGPIMFTSEGQIIHPGGAWNEVELAAWLALHPDSTGAQVERALVIGAAARASYVSRLRRWIGADTLPAATAAGRRLRLNAAVDVDAVAAVCRPSGHIDQTAPDAALVAALEIVRGESLADIEGDWADGERLHWSLTIADVAAELARRRQSSGDVEGARWAVCRGMIASPGNILLAEILKELQVAGRSRCAELRKAS